MINHPTIKIGIYRGGTPIRKTKFNNFSYFQEKCKSSKTLYKNIINRPYRRDGCIRSELLHVLT